MRIARLVESRWLAWALGAATLVGFGASGWWLMQRVQGRDPAGAIIGPWPWWLQAAAGLGLGWGMGLLAWRLVERKAMGRMRARFAALVGPLMPDRPTQLFVSACAGIGEELFFRGAIQHWLGIVPTAFVFVALHGYIDPRHRAMLAYGLFMTAAICVLGWAAGRAGLLLPMAAHAMIDVVLIGRLAAAHRAAQS